MDTPLTVPRSKSSYPDSFQRRVPCAMARVEKNKRRRAFFIFIRLTGTRILGHFRNSQRTFHRERTQRAQRKIKGKSKFTTEATKEHEGKPKSKTHRRDAEGAEAAGKRLV